MALHAWTITAIVFVVLVLVILVVSSVYAVLGAINSFNSAYYNVSAPLRSAYSYLTIAGALGFSVVLVLFVIALVAIFTDGFTVESATDELLKKQSFSGEDIATLAQHRKHLKSSGTAQIFVLTVVIILFVMTFVVGILATIAAVDIGGMLSKDTTAETAYTDAVVASVLGMSSIFFTLMIVVAYLGVRSSRLEKILAVEDLKLERVS